MSWEESAIFSQILHIFFTSIHLCFLKVTETSDLNLTKIILTQPKQIGLDQNNLYMSKTIWTVQNNFGLIEGQDIRLFATHSFTNFSSIYFGKVRIFKTFDIKPVFWLNAHLPSSSKRQYGTNLHIPFHSSQLILSLNLV